MNGVPAEARSAAIEMLDLDAVDESLKGVPDAVWALGPWAAALLIGRSIAKLQKSAPSGNAVATLEADLLQNGVGARFQELAQSPERLAQFGAVTRAAALVVPVPQLSEPRAPGSVERTLVTSSQVLSRLSSLSSRVAGREATFASVAQLGGILTALRFQGRGDSVQLTPPLPPHLQSTEVRAPWREWSTTVTCLGGALGALGFGARGALLTPDLLTCRLDTVSARAVSSPRPLSVTLPPGGVTGLATLVSALGAIELARRQLAVDLLRPGWQQAFSKMTASAADATQRLTGTASINPGTADLERLTSVRATLAGISRLDGMGVSLRAPDGAQRLDALVGPLQRATVPPAVQSGGSAVDRSVLRRLLRELVTLYTLLMNPVARRQAGTSGEKK